MTTLLLKQEPRELERSASLKQKLPPRSQSGNCAVWKTRQTLYDVSPDVSPSSSRAPLPRAASYLQDLLSVTGGISRLQGREEHSRKTRRTSQELKEGWAELGSHHANGLSSTCGTRD